MFKLRNYQENHVNELKDKINKFLNFESTKICVFKSPTGSGKTIMMAEVIRRLVENRDDEKQLAFVWIAVHKLHKQSKEKLENYYEDWQGVTCSYFEDLEDKQIQDREILFFNWQSIYQEKNIYIKENEDEFNLTKVIEKTKNEGKEVILIIDESHHTASGDKAKEAIMKINPKVTIEVSATPKITNTDDMVSIDLEEVKSEEMIKKSIKLNSKLKNIDTDTTDELIIHTALEKRKHLKNCYEGENSDVNPLVLIQIPDARKDLLDRKDEIIKLLDSKFNINTHNGKLAIYLSDNVNKVNLENIEKKNNDVEVLIFKQAIALGWDCPRSSILVLFREWKMFEFSIQTIGRIIRMPETRHYDNEELNHAFVYTNISDVHIAEDVTKDFITIFESVRKDNLYDEINLQSIYFKRQHKKTRLNKEFYSIFEKIVKKYELLDKISTNVTKQKNQIITDVEIKNLDMEQNVKGGQIYVMASDLDLQRKFDAFAIEMAEPFAQKHSHEVLMRSINSFYENNTDITDLMEMMKITLQESNKKHFTKVIRDAKDTFTKDVVEKIEREIEYSPKWNVPENTEYTKIYKEKDYKKCIMSPAYIKTNIGNEIDFMDFLEEKNDVKWWFKNEVNDKKYFAIKYIDPKDGTPRAFYVDFVVFMNDGKIGLFDPKKGFTITDPKTKPKAEALSRYIRDNKSKKVFGGITVFENGEWQYHDRKEYDCDGKDFSDWKSLDLG